MSLFRAILGMIEADDSSSTDAHAIKLEAHLFDIV